MQWDKEHAWEFSSIHILIDRQVMIENRWSTKAYNSADIQLPICHWRLIILSYTKACCYQNCWLLEESQTIIFVWNQAPIRWCDMGTLEHDFRTLLISSRQVLLMQKSCQVCKVFAVWTFIYHKQEQPPKLLRRTRFCILSRWSENNYETQSRFLSDVATQSASGCSQITRCVCNMSVTRCSIHTGRVCVTSLIISNKLARSCTCILKLNMLRRLGSRYFILSWFQFRIREFSQIWGLEYCVLPLFETVQAWYVLFILNHAWCIFGFKVSCR